jgi:hypothetical protein
MASPKQIGIWAAQAGFKGLDLQVAIAVALAESGGREDAHALTRKEDSRGLWQINVRAHPEFANTNLYDGATNARAAKAVLNKQGWRAWSAYKNGRFVFFMPLAQVTITRLPTTDVIESQVPGPVQNLVPDSAQALGQAVNLAARTGTFLKDPRSWLRILYVVIGAGMIVGGLLLFARPVIEPAIQAGAKVADIAL